MIKRLLIRADDLGYCEGVNLGIAKSVHAGIIRTVGVMPNMPDAEAGLAMLPRDDVCLGQHTNICAGKPLTDPARIPSLVDAGGNFKASRVYRSAAQDFVVLDEVILEIEAQYERFKALTGQEPDYFEGHAVASKNFFRGLEIVAERHGLKYVPFSLGDTPVTVGSTEVYLHMESMLPDYQPFASLKRVIENAHEGAVDVFVCHPGYLDAYILQNSSMTTPRVLELEMLCDLQVKRWLDAQQDLALVTYQDL